MNFNKKWSIATTTSRVVIKIIHLYTFNKMRKTNTRVSIFRQKGLFPKCEYEELFQDFYICG